MSGLSVALFVLALVTIGFGISVMQLQGRLHYLPQNMQVLLGPYLDNYQEAMAGMALLIVGLVIAGRVARNVLPEMPGGLELPIPKLRHDLLAFGAIALGSLCLAVLYWQLATNHYRPWDILLFAGGLSLLGLAVHRLDTHTQPSTLQVSRWDWLGALGLAVASGVLNCVDLTNWKFAYIGDESAFFEAARGYVEGRPWDVFNLSDVYQTHPALDSIYQALIMRLTGQVNVWGWRFSEVLVLSISVVLIYLLGVVLFGHLEGFVAGALIGFSHYLMAFTRIAYNNTHAIVYTTLVMLMLALAWRTQRAIYVYLLGVAMGFCVYTFQAAVIVWLPVTMLLLINFLRKPSWEQVVPGALMFAAFLIVVTPGFLTTPIDHVIQVAIQNSHREMAAVHPWLVARVSIVQSTFVWWVNHQWHNHYIGGPAVDWLTGILLGAGIGTALFRIRKRAERVVILWFVIGLVILSVTNYVPQPLLTRVLCLLPPVALLAAVAVAKLELMLRSALKLRTSVVQCAMLLPLVIVVPYLNMSQLLLNSPAKCSSTRQTMAMKAVQEHPGYLIVEVGKVPEGNTSEMFSLYPWLSSRYRFVKVGALRGSVAEGPGCRLPIYMVDQENRDIVQQVAEKVGGSYRVTTDWDPGHSRSTSLFMPFPGS